VKYLLHEIWRLSTPPQAPDPILFLCVLMVIMMIIPKDRVRDVIDILLVWWAVGRSQRSTEPRL